VSESTGVRPGKLFTALLKQKLPEGTRISTTPSSSDLARLPVVIVSPKSAPDAYRELQHWDIDLNFTADSRKAAEDMAWDVHEAMLDQFSGTGIPGVGYVGFVDPERSQKPTRFYSGEENVHQYVSSYRVTLQY
jgi:hypothetical protein